MKKSLETYLSGILDFAGLYPPANFSLEESFHKYVEHNQSSNSWMLAKFVVGSNLLEPLVKLINEDKNAPSPFNITVVATPSSDLTEFKQVVTNVVKQIAHTYSLANKEIRIPTLEIKLPEESLYGSDNRALIEAVSYTVKVMNRTKVLPHQVFFEIPGYDFEPKLCQKVMKVIAAHNLLTQNDEFDSYTFSGFKIRCGGLEEHQFPSPKYLANAIIFSRDENVPVKFTAGLHHPIRHYNDTVKTKMHGFLNVFGAAILSYTQDLTVHEVQTILEDEKAKSFTFTDQYFAWRKFAAPLLEIKMLRLLSVTSFGSCSFEEPVEDLQALKLLN